MRACALLSYYIKICIQWKYQELDAYKEDWLNLFKVKCKSSIIIKSMSSSPKWAIRTSNEYFKDCIAQQQASILFFNGAS
jgi:hypothetical protein